MVIFSKKIQSATFEAVKKSHLDNGGGILTDLQIVQVAQQAWEDLGIKDYFPGNAEVVLEKLMDNGKLGKTAADKPIWEKFSDAFDDISDMFSNLFSRGTAAGVGGMTRQITKNPMEMFSSSTLNTMLKVEGYTRHVTPDLRAVYFTDITGKTVYVSAPNVQSFTNSQGKTSYLFTDKVKNINEVAHLFNVPMQNIEEFDHRALGTIYADDTRGKTFIITPDNDHKKPIFALQEVKAALKSLGISMENQAACEAPAAQENSCKVESTYSQGAESSGQAYEVKKGDTVWSIAQEHGKTIKDILDTPGNEFLKDARHKDGNRIFPGEKIHVAGQQAEARNTGADSNSRDIGDRGGNSASSQTGNTREVHKGDTVWSIAQEHGKTVNDILNTPGNEFLKDARHDNGNRIFPGEKIHVAHSNSRGSDSRDFGDKDHSWGKGDNPFAAAERALGHSLETEARNIEKSQQASSHSTGRDYGGWEGGGSSGGGSSAEKSHSSGSHSSGSHSSGRDSSRGSSGGGSVLTDSRGNTVTDSRGNSIGVGRYKPVAIDLDGNGLEFLGFANSKVKFDIMMDGRLAKLDWINGKDGLLCYDANDNGRIDSSREISFSIWDPFSSSDLQALASVFDTNEDGLLDEKDKGFKKFYIWKDQNENAVQEHGELFQLIDFGIERIKLKGVMTDLVEGISNVVQISEVYYANNTIAANAYDITFEYSFD